MATASPEKLSGGEDAEEVVNGELRHLPERVLQERSQRMQDLLDRGIDGRLPDGGNKFRLKMCAVSRELSRRQAACSAPRRTTATELSRNGGILSLCRTILKLGVPECLKGSTGIAASVSRLKAKILSILLQVCEAESVSYLDEVATSSKSMQLGQALALEVLDLLKTAFGRKQKLTSDSHDKSYPMGSVLISYQCIASS